MTTNCSYTRRVLAVVAVLVIVCIFLHNNSPVSQVDDRTRDPEFYLGNGFSKRHGEVDGPRSFKTFDKFLTGHSADPQGARDWLQEQETRRETLRNGCRGLRDRNILGYHKVEALDKYVHTLVDHKHQIIYCGLQKVASTTLVHVIAKINGCHMYYPTLSVPEIRKFGMVPFTDHSQSERRRILAEYTTFLMVRHPLERLVSAFRQKFEYDKVEGDNVDAVMMSFKYGRDIMRLYRDMEQPWNVTSRYGKDPTFAEFARYLTDPVVPELYRTNHHWMRYLAACPVCEGFTPDFILHYEDYDTDLSWFLSLVYRIKPDKYVSTKKNSLSVNSASLYRDMLRELPRDLQDKLYDRYQYDIKAFGYDDLRK